MAKRTFSLKKLHTLHAVVNQMGKAGTREALFKIALSSIQTIFGLKSASILLLDDDDLVIKNNVGYDKKVTNFRIPVGEGVTGKVARTKKTIVVGDVQKYPGYIRKINRPGSEVATPLFMKRKLIGVVDAEKSVKNGFSSDEVALFEFFGKQIEIAMTNIDLYGDVRRHSVDLEKKVKNLEVLGDIGQKLSGTLEVSVLLNEILKLTRDALHFSRCAVMLIQPDGTKIDIRAAIGFDEKSLGEVDIRVGVGVTGWVAKYGVPLLVPDVRSDLRYIGDYKNVKSEMAVPLIVMGETIGLLNAETLPPHTFSVEDLELFATFASQVASAIYNANLYQSIREKNFILQTNVIEMERMNRQLTDANVNLENRMRELSLINDASRVISSSIDLDSTLESIATITQQILNVPSCVIRLTDTEYEKLREQGFDQEDDNDDKRTLSRNRHAHASDGMQFPLTFGSETIGIFDLNSKTPLSENDRKMLSTIAGQAAVAIENAKLFQGVKRTYFSTIKSLVNALEARDSYTKGHSERVTKVSLMIARELKLNKDTLNTLAYAAILHDIGKIGIRDHVLNKPGLLDTDERKIISDHPTFGHHILEPIKFLKDSKEVILHHHERFDGTGYPRGLKGVEIPLLSRIIAVADAFDAIAYDRIYRKGLGKDAAVSEIEKFAGRQFDPDVVKAFMQIAHKLQDKLHVM